MFILLAILTLFNHHWTPRPDLSYQPRNAPATTGNFARVDLFFLKAGSEAEGEALAKRHAEIDRQAGIGHAREIYVANDGADRPVMMQIVRANSRAEYEAERKKSDALRGARIRPVYEATSKIVRRFISIDEYALPGANGLVTLDYLAFDHRTGRLWVPGGNTQRVDVIDDASVREVRGFATRAFALKGRRGFLGPSSVSVGESKVYVGNRADGTVCAIDARTLRRRCVHVAAEKDGWAAAPDAVVYVRPTHELWITRGAPPLGIPSIDHAITILDADSLREKGRLPLAGSAEGYAVDDHRGIFYTNLEESGETVAIDVRSHELRSRWRSGCDEPHGIAIDAMRRNVFVACSDRVIALDAGHDGKVLDTIATGEGLDNIDFFDGRLYAAASLAATMTIAAFDERFHDAITIPSVKGARVVVAGANGEVWVADPIEGRVLRITVR